MISHALVLEWNEHPVTKKLIKILETMKHNNVYALTSGQVLGADVAQTTARIIGRLEVIEGLLTADFKEGEL